MLKICEIFEDGKSEFLETFIGNLIATKKEICSSETKVKY